MFGRGGLVEVVEAIDRSPVVPTELHQWSGVATDGALGVLSGMPPWKVLASNSIAFPLRVAKRSDLVALMSPVHR